MSQYDLSRPVLEQVREAADIVAVVGEHLTLRKTGRNYVGLCPFHGEKTGSFNVSREKGTYYCFGCKRGGDVIDFVMEMERVAFAEAVERLADRFGVRLPPPPRKRGGARTSRNSSPTSWRRRRRCLPGNSARTAPAPSSSAAAWRSTSRRSSAWGTPETSGGRSTTSCAASSPSAPWSARAWSSRATEGRSGTGSATASPSRSAAPAAASSPTAAAPSATRTPKYLNSPETSLFSKGHVLFALDRAMRAFPKTNRAIVVEGYFDCIALHRVGLTETVATLGTALSEHHAAEFARRVPHVVVCFDGDNAGRQAAVAALRTLLAAALEVSVLVLPDGQDPDDVARREGAEGFGRRAAAALPAAEFLLELMGSTRQERRRNLLHSLEVVNACPDPVRRFEMRETLARGAGIPLEELGGLESTRMVARQAVVEGLPENAELALLRSFLHDLEPADSAAHLRGFPIDGICHPGVRRVFEVLQRRLAGGGTLEIAGVLSEVDDPGDRRLLAGLELEAPKTPRERIPSLIELVRRRADRLRSSEIVVRIRAAELAGDRDALARLQAEQSELIKRPKRGT